MTSVIPGKKRFLIALPLGIVAGLICTAFAASSTPNIWAWDSALMWTIITNRWLIGLVVGLAGAYDHHPVFGFPLPAYLRGFMLGAAVSVTLAAGAMMSPETPWAIFWATIIVGGIYGLVIDVIVTKWSK